MVISAFAFWIVSTTFLATFRIWEIGVAHRLNQFQTIFIFVSWHPKEKLIDLSKKKLAVFSKKIFFKVCME